MIGYIEPLLASPMVIGQLGIAKSGKKAAMFEDSTFWLFVAPGLLLGLYAQARIKANYVRYSRVATSGGIAGAQVARALLDARGLQRVRIESTPGMLRGQHDQQTKPLPLSPAGIH